MRMKAGEKGARNAMQCNAALLLKMTQCLPISHTLHLFPKIPTHAYVLAVPVQVAFLVHCYVGTGSASVGLLLHSSVFPILAHIAGSHNCEVRAWLSGVISAIATTCAESSATRQQLSRSVHACMQW